MTECGRIAHRASRIASSPLLQITDLAVSFDLADGGRARAVDGVSLTIHPRQTLALVGESGCGKSVTALCALGLVPQPPGRVERGRIVLEGRDLLALNARQMREVRGRRIAMIFQDPMTSLNPVYTVGDQLLEAIRLHRKVDRRGAAEAAVEAMTDVGIPDPVRRLRAYPHEFSGGMQQRVMIAMALACRPQLLVADEPTTALDVTVQAQILDLLRRLRRSRDMALLLISHDLGVVAENADTVCVMYAGRVVEYASVYDLFERPRHPYTRGLMACILRLDETRRRLTSIEQVIGPSQAPAALAGRDGPIIPWWPAGPRPDGVGETSGAGDSVLYEIAPHHWVACWRTESLADHPSPTPDIDFRRDEWP